MFKNKQHQFISILCQLISRLLADWMFVLYSFVQTEHFVYGQLELKSTVN